MITKEIVDSILTYNPETGDFVSNVNSNKWKIGQTVGSLRKDGYLSVMINGKNYMLHRLAFLIMEGEMPEKLVDHINRNRVDNRWCNLRKADYELNCRNAGLAKNNKSGHKGISFHKKSKKWQVFISQDGKPVYLGLFASIQEAVEARNKAEIIYNYPKD